MDSYSKDLNIAIWISLILSIAKECFTECPGGVSLCEWTEWNSWDSCSNICGTNELSFRDRSLCCREDWVVDDTCEQNCDKTFEGYSDMKYCGNLCYYGGYFNFACFCKDRFYGTCCEQRLNTCEPFPTDILFVLDSSVSQTIEHFKKQLDFVINFVDQLDIGNEGFHVGLITFSFDAVLEIHPSSGMSKDDLKAAIRKIEFRPGATYTHKGLKLAFDLASTVAERRPGMSTLSYTLVLTDGMSTNRKLTEDKASQLKRSSQVIAIGIGDEVSHRELNTIASPGDSYSPSYVFSVENFDALNTLLKRLVEATCPKCSQSSLTDIIFLIDVRPDSMTEKEFQIVLDTVIEIVNNLGAYGEINGQNVGVYFIGSSENKELALSNSARKEHLLAYLQTVRRSVSCFDSTCDDNNNTTFETIQHAADNYFNEASGGRNNSRKILLTATSGRLAAIETQSTNYLSYAEVELVALASGYDADMVGLTSLVSDPSQVFVTLDNSNMDHLKVLHSKFTYVTCV